MHTFHDYSSPAPEGFILGKLQLKHAKLVADNWSYYDGWPNKVPYVEALISNYENRALFVEDDPDTPVAWSIQYPTGESGFAFVVEKYRKKGLIQNVWANLGNATIANGFVPPYFLVDKNVPQPSAERGSVPLGCIWKSMYLEFLLV